MVLEGFFSIYSQWTIMTPRVWTNFDPRGMVGRIYVGDHWTLLYIKYISCGPELKGDSNPNDKCVLSERAL